MIDKYEEELYILRHVRIYRKVSLKLVVTSHSIHFI